MYDPSGQQQLEAAGADVTVVDSDDTGDLVAAPPAELTQGPETIAAKPAVADSVPVEDEDSGSALANSLGLTLAGVLFGIIVLTLMFRRPAS